jgi:hypothetical protein
MVLSNIPKMTSRAQGLSKEKALSKDKPAPKKDKPAPKKKEQGGKPCSKNCVDPISPKIWI